MFGARTRGFITVGLFAGALLGAASASLGKIPGNAHARWRLGSIAHPADNQATPERVELGKKLFFDPRLSGAANMSCASCHNPMFGWSDGLPTARGNEGKLLPRATPSVLNLAYGGLFMWDGRMPTLEAQAVGPITADAEMNMPMPVLLDRLTGIGAYQYAFASAYPGEGITPETIGKALATFERTLITNDTPFDRWLAGDETALTPEQVLGFQVFTAKDRGNCETCHAAPTFSDDGFHNVGLASFGREKPDRGRFTQKPIKVVDGAFKTPMLRGVALTAPYFHDGSATTLEEVVEHYVKGGVVKTNLSPNMKPVKLDAKEKHALVAFLHALTPPQERFTLPILPLDPETTRSLPAASDESPKETRK